MRNITAGLLLGMGLTATSGAFAASSADLSVIGTIVPTACDIELSTHEIQLGKISSSDLLATSATELTAKNVNVEVACEAAARFSLSAKDNKAGSAYDSAETSFGLGKTSHHESFGYFSLRFDGTTLKGDSGSVIGLASVDNLNWAPAPISPAPGGLVQGPALAHGANFLAFGDGGAPTVVKNIKDFVGTLQVRTFIAPTEGLTLDGDESFAGSATIEINYL